MFLLFLMSLFFPFSPQWVFPVPSVRGGRFVVSFAGSAPLGFVPWLRAHGVIVEAVFPCPAWRSFASGCALRLFVADATIAEAVKKSAPKGGGGSLHPGNAMLG